MFYHFVNFIGFKVRNTKLPCSHFYEFLDKIYPPLFSLFYMTDTPDTPTIYSTLQKYDADVVVYKCPRCGLYIKPNVPLPEMRTITTNSSK